VKNKKKSLVNS